MGEVINFNNRRKRDEDRRKRDEFRRGLRVDGTIQPTNGMESRVRDSETTKERLNARRARIDAKVYASLPEEERKWIERRIRKLARKGKIRGYRVSDAHRIYEVIRGVKALVVSAIATLGVVLAAQLGQNAYTQYVYDKNATALEEIVQYIGDSELSEGEQREVSGLLGVGNERLKELANLYEILNSEDIHNMTNEELSALGEMVEGAQMATIKEKLAEAFGVDVEAITLEPNFATGSSEPPTARVRVEINGEEIYYDRGDLLDRNNNISEDIIKGILSIGNTQTAIARLEEGNVNREAVIAQLESGVNGAIGIAVGMSWILDENGNVISCEISNEDMERILNFLEEESTIGIDDNGEER